jgi:hypothetical protein
VFRVPPCPRCHILYLHRGTIIWSLASPRPRVYITLLSRSRESDKPRHFLSACVYVRACTQARGTRGIAEMRIRITALAGKVGEAADESCCCCGHECFESPTVEPKSGSTLTLVMLALSSRSVSRGQGDSSSRGLKRWNMQANLYK